MLTWMKSVCINQREILMNSVQSGFDSVKRNEYELHESFLCLMINFDICIIKNKISLFIYSVNIALLK